MKRILALAAVAPFLLATIAADGAPAPAAACDRDAGRETLDLDGLELEMLAPGVTAPELAATHEVTGDLVTPYRSSTFPMILDVAPHPAAKIDVSLSWTNPNDYDIYVYAQEPDGFEYGAGTSNDSNIDGGTNAESVTTQLDDCTPLRIEIRNWAGSPTETLTLDVTVTPIGDPATDVLPREDTRTPLYLAGDRPGQLGTFKHGSLGAEQIPLTTAFSEERPSDNTPNTNTRALIGTEIERNPFQPFWFGQFDETDILAGQASAVVWLSSQTQQQDPGVVKVTLFVNGAESSVEIPGELIGRDPAPFFVTFPQVFEDEELFSLTFQATTLPQASPNTPSEKRGDAQHTVLYDSLQFQSAVYLPTTAG